MEKCGVTFCASGFKAHHITAQNGWLPRPRTAERLERRSKTRAWARVGAPAQRTSLGLTSPTTTSALQRTTALLLRWARGWSLDAPFTAQRCSPAAVAEVATLVAALR